MSGALVGVVIIGTALTGGDEPSTNTARTSTTTQVRPAGTDAIQPAIGTPTATASAAHGFGTEVRDGKFAFVVTDMESGLSTIGRESSMFSEKAEGQFVVVHVDVTNISKQPQYYSSLNQVLVDEQGREFTNDSGAEFSLEGDDEGDGDINPGITRSTRVVFDIPIGTVPVALEVHDSMFSNGARVSFG
ncbi:DUF4352 domain-containing protein [Rhodococcus sp. NPDC059968]|uniref:DUF4352 domain-containing protein n=1 Tax=Rhodococcus sp. NPDC059968 TaxID=3347017 RepID=UPI003670E63C